MVLCLLVVEELSLQGSGFEGFEGLIPFLPPLHNVLHHLCFLLVPGEDQDFGILVRAKLGIALPVFWWGRRLLFVLRVLQLGVALNDL